MSLIFAARPPHHRRRLTWPPLTLLVFDYPSPPHVFLLKLPSPPLITIAPERMRAGKQH